MTDDDPIAEQLSRLALPRPSAARMHYAAGFAAGRRRARAWQATAVVAVAGAVAAGHRPVPSPVLVDRIVYVHPPTPAADPPPAAEADSILRLRQADVTVLPPVGGCGKQRVTVGLLWPRDLPSGVD